MNRFFWLFLNLWNTWIVNMCFSTNQNYEMSNSQHLPKAPSHYTGFSTFCACSVPSPPLDSLACASSWTPFERGPTKKNVQKEPCFLGKKKWYLGFLSSCIILLRTPNKAERTWWVLLQDPRAPLRVTSFHLVLRQLREQVPAHCFFFFFRCLSDHTSVCSLVFQNQGKSRSHEAATW